MGVYEVSVEGQFRASHAVRLPDGSFEPRHEHRWNVIATFRSKKLDPVMGVVIDFLTAHEALSAVTSPLEGVDLNERINSTAGASAERLAEYLAKALMQRLGAQAHLYRLAVSEAQGCWAAWYPRGT